MRTAADIARARGGQPVPGGGFLIRCPVPSHGQGRGDRNPSLTIADGDKGLVVSCKCGCNPREVLVALGYVPNGKANGKPSGANGLQHEPPKRFSDYALTRDNFQQTAAYAYVDLAGEVLYEVLRYEHPTETKTFLQRRPDGRGGWWSGAGSRKVLYRWPDLAKHRHKTAFITEGEKDADRLTSHGLLAVTVASGSWSKEAIESLKGYDCYILEDNDRAGRTKAQKAAEALHGVAGSVRVVRLPGLPDGGDVSDWLDAGNDVQRLPDIAKAAPEWRPEGEQQKAEKTPDAPGDDIVDEFNSEWAVILSRKGTHIMRFTHEEVGDGSVRRVIEYKTASDLRLFYGNRFVTVGQKPTCVADVWLRHPNRKQYKGLIFDPNEGDVVDGKLNLWRGLGVKPRPGDWTLTRRHIKEVLANGDRASDAYIIKWMGWAVQNPSRHCETAVVFRGQKGTGKGLLGKALLRLFGQHGIHISDPRHLVGNFNAHMQDAILMFVDEGFWGGDVRHDGALKRLITEPTLFIEPKGIDAYMAPNRLKILMASNETWVVPATEDERRYAVFDVSSKHKGDRAYFDAIFNELDSGGLEAMLHDLQAMDLKGWHPREIVKTEGLKRQQVEGLKPLDRWWLSMLEEGVISAADPSTPHMAVTEPHEHVTSFGQKIMRPGLLGHIRASSPRLRDFSAKALGDFLAEKGCERRKRVQGRRGWQFPPLKAAREEWAKRFEGWSWPNPAQGDWEPSEAEDEPNLW